jgi:glutamate 5-kinase
MDENRRPRHPKRQNVGAGNRVKKMEQKQINFKRIAVKVGSNVLTRTDGTLNITRMSALVDQIAELKRAGVSVALISSGAVASGRSEIYPDRKLDDVSARQLFSAVGQAKLINRYYELFREHHISCGQVLTMKENFASRRLFLNQKHCMETMLENGVIPIVNENDAVSVTELMFTDNDELSGMIAAMIGVDALIILTNVDGVYDGDPSVPGSKIISKIAPDDKSVSATISQHTVRSQFGRGGILTKCSVARKVAGEGITVIIANGLRDSILTDLLNDGNQTPCTRFLPSPHPISSVKKWIAHSETFAKGQVIVNDGAREVLLQPKASSLLFVGVHSIEGEFEKDDIVRIMDANGNHIGVGCSAYNSADARNRIGSRSLKPLVHYDYLYINPDYN